MAMLAVAAAGSMIGGTLITGTVMGMSGAAIGWMAGSMLGSMLFKPPPTEGPRIEDKKVSSSTYGNAIPFVWGTDRVAAQFIWSSDLIEHKEEVGGKGFGGPDGIMYKYSVNVLLCVCESPVAKPRYPLRLWGNGRLIGTFNGSTWDVDEALIQRSNLREYIGASDQMPDPVYEAAVGIENAPAYRGRLTIMLEGLQLADFGNRCPNFEVEVTSEISVEQCPTTPILTTLPAKPPIYQGPGGAQDRFAAAYDPETRRYFVLTTGGSQKIEIYDIRQGEAPRLSRIVPLAFGPRPTNFAGIAIDPENRLLWIVIGDAGTTTYIDPGDSSPLAVQIDLDTLQQKYSGARLHYRIQAGGGVCKVGEAWVVCKNFVHDWGNFPEVGWGGDARDAGHGAWYGAMIRIHPDAGTPRGEISWGISSSAIIMYRMVRLRNGETWLIEQKECPDCAEMRQEDGVGWHQTDAAGASNWTTDILYIPKPPIELSPLLAWNGGINYQFTWKYTPTARMIDGESSTDLTGATIERAANTTAVFSRSRRKVYVINGGKVSSIDLSLEGNPTQFTEEFRTLSSLDASSQRVVWSEYADALVTIKHTSSFGTIVTVIDPETDEVLAGPCTYEWDNIVDGHFRAVNEVGGGWFVAVSSEWIPGANPDRVVMFKIPGAISWGNGIPLFEIVSDVWEQSGGDPFDIDVSELTDIVPGYTRARQLAGRGVLEPLRAGYFFDGVESGSLLKFPKRGKTEVATIDAGELGAHVFELTGAGSVPAYEQEHIDELDAPRELTLEYIDATANYDPGTQRAMRGVGGSIAPATMNVPVVLDADYAAQVAWTTLMSMHGAKNPIRFTLPHSREALEPADAILLPMANGEYQRVVLGQRTSARPMVEFEGVLEDPAIWDAIFPGVPRGQLPRQGYTLEVEDTLLEILDLPPLRAEDDRIVAYFALARVTGDAWPGASVYRDSGSLSLVYSTQAEATMGELASALPAWTGGNRWDRTSTFRVWLRRGTLSSATRLAVYNGANAAVVGDEIIQFVNATLVGEDLWEIDTLLRHRIGTEWAATEHAIGSRFVLLSAAALRAVEYGLSDLNVERTFRAVTSGQVVADGRSAWITATGNSIKPLAPVHVQGTRSDDDLSVTWIRRARINADWQDLVDVPLDETGEQYEIKVFTDVTRLVQQRQITVSSPAWTYTAVDQAADFGAPQAAVFLSIRQVSPKYGAYGHAAEATL